MLESVRRRPWSSSSPWSGRHLRPSPLSVYPFTFPLQACPGAESGSKIGDQKGGNSQEKRISVNGGMFGRACNSRLKETSHVVRESEYWF